MSCETWDPNRCSVIESSGLPMPPVEARTGCDGRLAARDRGHLHRVRPGVSDGPPCIARVGRCRPHYPTYDPVGRKRR